MNIEDKNLNSEIKLTDTDFVSVMQKLNAISFEARNIDELLNNAIQEVLDFFQCDRAWLLYPCDPTSDSFEIRTEKTRPEWPGGGSSNQPIAMSNEFRQVLTETLIQNRPLVWDSKQTPALQKSFNSYSIKTQITLPLLTRVGKPWMIGLHYCADHHRFSDSEIELFSVIGRRIAESLSTSLAIIDLFNNEERYRLLIETMAQGVICQNKRGEILEINPAAEKILGMIEEEFNYLPVAGYWGAPIDQNGCSIPPNEHPALVALIKDKTVNNQLMGVYHNANKCYHWIVVNAVPQHQKEDEIPQVVVTFSDITSLKKADEALKAHLYFLDAMERINRVTISDEPMDVILNRLLDEILDIFHCDRAWFLYPCDPSVISWQIRLQKNRHRWQAMDLGIEQEMTNDSKILLENALNSEKPICMNVVSDNEFPNQSSSKNYKTKSQMYFPIRPKTDSPWLLGIHHCEFPHFFGDEEVKLFEEITRRISDALSTLTSMQNLRESEERFRTMIEHAPEAIFVLDVDKNKLIDANENVSLLFKSPQKYLFENEFTNLSPTIQLDGSLSSDVMLKKILRALNGEAPTFEWMFINRAGEKVHCEVRLIRLPAQGRNLVRASVTDITIRQHEKARMHMLSSALQQTADSILITDTSGSIEYVNAAFEATTGYSYKEARQKKYGFWRTNELEDDALKSIRDTVSKGHIFSDVLINKRKDGTLYYEEKTVTPLKNNNGEITHFISSGRDITERMESQERLQFLAHHDVLTELPNRLMLLERLNRAIKRAKREEKTLAVLFLDLDRFKIINDTLGHEIGDQYLQKIARRLVMNLRATDTVARFGGDEFVILLESVNYEDEIIHIVNKLLIELSSSLTIKDHELVTSGSIGISIFPKDAQDSHTLLKYADTAMYKAKEQGRNTFEFYSIEMSAKAFERLSLETQLRYALKRHEFEIYYQPQISIVSKKIIGAEALLRWNSPSNNSISPDVFVPILEEIGLITAVGEWVLQSSCESLQKWKKFTDSSLRLSVNLSSRQFKGRNLENLLISIIKERNIPMGSLEIEITESLLMDYEKSTHEMLNRLSKMGVRLSIDDFGTGYSSLSYLKRFPINTLKIDRSFINDICTDPDDAAIVTAIIAMAKSLNIDIVAEGVETQAQLDFLEKKSCNLAQGFYFSEAIPEDDFIALLSEEFVV